MKFHTHDMRHTRRAFTLIELLTVIAIIGILAAIIIPTVGRVRDSAKASQCISNLRQIGMALRLYVNENKGFLPVSTRARLPTEPGTASAVPWGSALSAYLPLRGRTVASTEHEIFVCPAAEFHGKRGKDLRSTYTASAAIIGLSNGAATATTVPRAIGSIDNTRLTQIPMLLEGKANGAFFNTHPCWPWTGVQADMSKAGPSETLNIDFRHADRMNVAYVDGSVRRMDFAAFKTIDQRTYSGLPAL